MDNGTTSYIIQAEQQYADKAIEQPLLIRNTTNEIPHCFVITTRKVQNKPVRTQSSKPPNPPLNVQSSNSSQDLLQEEQQLEDVLVPPREQVQQPTTSKVRTYVSTQRNTGSAFVDRVNSFGDLRTPDQLN